ncbi:NADH-quinone oxidoreductase subunit G [Cyclonatronum proteinivorum]|uniref:NADH-quinone oxidoreductase subunit G n=1 Tax=Cyclonatronum proteinivorum TaxID=1457365 RepID=A0A345UKX9_9BACT|nr:(2Fe-2S)-binding protein [Cyclonatronum proteinivorum]AXJ01131.1 NADH-quinone oxidoreductase subunit G [Cyclonatronum proteinivorum]
MPEIFIDNVRYEFEGKPLVLQFMLDNGMDHPFFCYHPSLSVPANCRQCYVEAGTPVWNRETNDYELDEKGERVIRFFPKLMTACSLEASDGMVIKTQRTSELVKRAHKDTLEFILVNHPLDCPICDQAGECPLQIQTYKYGPEGSRFEHKKVHKPKRIKLGPRVILDAERCINCTRCVRFTEEISKTHQLTIISRGDKNYPAVAPGTEFDDPYSLNTVDICPVGALTSADFRFKARVWEMNQTPGVDVTNGTGCNIDVWTRDNLVLRITPRFNAEVNDHWMPDFGREDIRRMNENRISKPEMTIEGDRIKSSWQNAELTLWEKLKAFKAEEILFVGSAFSSVEDNFVLQKHAARLDIKNVYFSPFIKVGSGDGFLIDDDQYPNTQGCRLLGLEELSGPALKDKVTASSVKLIVMLEDDIVGRGIVSASDLDGKFVVYMGSNNNETSKAASLVVPIANSVEQSCSYVNVKGRIQRTTAAKETIYTNRKLDLEMSVGRLDRYGTKFDNWVSDRNRIDCIPAWEFLERVAAQDKANFGYTSTRAIMTEIASVNEHFSGVDYNRMDEEPGIQLISDEKVKTA